MKKIGLFSVINDYIVKPIKEAWARFVEFAGGMDRIKKIVGIALAIMFAPILAIPLLIWGVVKLFKMLADKVGGFGNLIKIALMIAFAPLFLAWEAMKAVGNFIGGLFGGGGDKSKAAAPAGEEAKDFISRPGTGMEKFSPKDTVVGVQDPGALGGGGGADMSVTNEKLQEMINEIIALRTSMDTGQKKLTKKVGDIGVAG